VASVTDKILEFVSKRTKCIPFEIATLRAYRKFRVSAFRMVVEEGEQSDLPNKN